MNSAGFYQQGASITNSLGESAFITPPNSNPRFVAGHPPFRQQSFVQPDITAVDQKLDRLLAIVMEQKETVAQQGKEAADVKGQLQSIVGDLTVIKSSMETIHQGGRKQKKAIPRELSMSVRNLHEKFPCEQQFSKSEGYRSEQNRCVRKVLCEQLIPMYSEKYSPNRVERAVHRYYESRRRLFNDAKPARREKALATKVKSRKQSLRRKLYIRRQKYLKGDLEKEMWASITEDYMTEESDDEEGNSFRQHHLKWRSDSLNKLVKKLDKRSKKVSSNCQSKPRLLSTPSTLDYPEGAPEWAIAPEWASARDEEGEKENTHPCINAIEAARKTMEFLDSDSDSSDSVY